MVDDRDTEDVEDVVDDETEDDELYEDVEDDESDIDDQQDIQYQGEYPQLPATQTVMGQPMILPEYGEYPQDVGTTMSDNDYINLLRDITDPNLRKQIDHFIKHNPLTPAAIHKLKIYYRGVLNMGLVASNVRNEKDFLRIQDRYLIIKCEMPLGLTCYDVNDTFGHVVNIIDLNFFNQELRAIGGFHMKRIATTTSESIQHDASVGAQYDQRVQEQSTIQKLTSFLR